MPRKSNTACHAEFKSGSNAIYPPQVEKRKRSSSSEKRINEPVVTRELTAATINDEVFEENDPYQESIFVYSARDSVKRKARKNLLTFKSPPPPEILDSTTLTGKVVYFVV